MLFHASLATPRSFPLFLLNCVQIGKFKICTQLTTLFQATPSAIHDSGMGLSGGIACASGYFWE